MHLQYKLTDLYERLLKSYGYQGWWPLYYSIPPGVTFGNYKKGYHPGDYNFPQNSVQKLEICLGAILTQNTKWQNVVSALHSLNASNLFSLTALQKATSEQIAVAIKSAGYYNQKSQTIKRLVTFLRAHPFAKLKNESTPVAREKLLSIKGIGPETADCILLYALDKTSFVIDAYTTRICRQLRIIDKKTSYAELKHLFESSLEKKKELFQEYHALLVCHGKMYYSRKPYGVNDPMIDF